MTSASYLVLTGVLGLTMTGMLTYRLSSVTLGRLWTILASAGVLLFAWAQFEGGTSGLYATALLLIFVLPVFIGTLMAGVLNAWIDRPTAAGGAEIAEDDGADGSGDRGIDLLLRRSGG